MRVRISLFLMALLLSSQALYALDFTLSAGGGVQYTDNALKVADNEESDYETRLDGSFGLDHEGKSWLVNMDYRASYLEFADDTQSDSTEVNGIASVQYEQFDDVLFWNLSNSIRSIVSDRQDTDISDNRENRSISTFSPVLRMPLSRVDSLNTTVSYSKIAYEENNQQDSERLGGSVGWMHRFSRVDSLDLTGAYYDVSFDSALSEYEYYTARLTYASTLSKLSYSLVAGYNETQREIFEDTDGPYLNANFVYEDGFSQWELNLLQELTDTSRGNNNGNLTELGDSASASGRVDVYEVLSGELSYNTEAVCSVCVISLSVLASEESYEILPDDNRELSARVGFDYNFSRRSSLGVDAAYSDTTFTGNNPRADFNLQIYNIFFQRFLTRNFSMRLSSSFEKRDSDAASDKYEEIRGGISVSYEFL